LIHIVMHDGARCVVRISENGSAMRSNGFWINIGGAYTTPQEVVAAYEQVRRAVEEIFEAVLGEEAGPVDPEVLRQADEALTDAVARHPH